MVRHKRIELESPPFSRVITGAICSIISFFSLPFILWRISDGYHTNPSALAWFELAFHSLNAVIVYYLFREYLEDSLLNMQLNREHFINVVAVGSGLILSVAVIIHLVYHYTGNEHLEIAAFAAAPVTGMDILVLGGIAAASNPVVTTLYTVLLTPAIASCLFYAIGFSYFYNIQPILGYVTASFAVAFPRICCAATWWIPDQQLVYYLAQLPAHLICCWAYKKTDTVWAPIVILMVVNLISCIAVPLVYYTR